jgi:hypothetical protein
MEKERVTEATPTIDTAKVGIISEITKETAKNVQYNPLDDLRQRLDADADEAAQTAANIVPSWKKYVFDFADRNISMPDYLLSINGIGMFARRSLTCITGRAGQGKSQSLIPFTAAPLAQRELLGVTPLRPVKQILWADSEQERWGISEKANRLLRLMGMPDFSPTPPQLIMLTTRQASSNQERLEVTKDAIEDITPDVVILDGITDMVQHMEDPDEAQQLVADLLKRIDERDITLFVVIHQNEGGESNKLRAFIGSELMRKASNILQVSVKAGCFEIEQTKSRSVPMPIYRFRIDAQGNLTQSMVENPQTEEGRLADIMQKVIDKRKGTFESKSMIYTFISSVTGESKSRAKSIYERAEALGVISQAYDGHKYKLSLNSGNSGKLDFCSGE